MIIGKVPGDDETVRLDVEIRCNSCGKRVPGGIKTGKRYSQTEEFRAELEEFLQDYLCGVCRNTKRVSS